MNNGVLNNEVIKGVFCTMCVIALVAGVVLVLMGYSSLEATEYGLDYSWVSKSVSNFKKFKPHLNNLFF